jgi:hypothetical protein
VNRAIWELHVAAFELARGCGLGEFAVQYTDTGAKIEIALALPAGDDAFAREPTACPSESPG